MTEPKTREMLKHSNFGTTHNVLKYLINSLLQQLSKLKTNVIFLQNVALIYKLLTCHNHL